MTINESDAADGAIFVIRQEHNELYVAPSADVAVAHVRKHHQADPASVKLADFAFFQASGQALTLLTTPDGMPAALANLERITLEDRVWTIIRQYHDELQSAKETADDTSLLDALISESLTLDELARTLAAHAAPHGPEHVEVRDAGETTAPPGDGEPPHEGSAWHNLCHALHLC